jgi:hypothetical protein
LGFADLGFAGLRFARFGFATFGFAGRARFDAVDVVRGFFFVVLAVVLVWDRLAGGLVRARFAGRAARAAGRGPSGTGSIGTATRRVR